MRAHTGRTRYGTVAIAFHWVVAAAIVVMIGLGLYSDSDSASHRTTLIGIHALLGITTLLLMLARLAWRFISLRPDDLTTLPRWQAVTSHVVHHLLYAIVIALGGSGLGLVVMSRALPGLLSHTNNPLPNFHEFLPMLTHKFLAYALIGLVLVHVLAALHHQFVRRDRLLSRMGIGKAPGR